MRFAKDLLRTRDFDVMLCEVPEHVRAWRVAQERTGNSFPIVAMVEHVDFYEQTRVPAARAVRQSMAESPTISVAFTLTPAAAARWISAEGSGLRGNGPSPPRIASSGK